MKTQNRIPSVAIFLITSVSTNREILNGILRYEREHGPWSLNIFQGRDDEELDLDLSARHYDAAIGNFLSLTNRRSLHRANIPVVIAHSEYLPVKAPRLPWLGYILCNNQSIAQGAAEFFRSRGFNSFAFVGARQPYDWSDERLLFFRQTLQKDGYPVTVYSNGSSRRNAPFEKEKPLLSQFLRRLPKPCAVFAANDTRAQQIINACLKEGIAIPEEISVLGVDNEKAICETTTPSLTSIAMTTEEVGYQAAKQLDAVVRNQLHNTTPHVFTYGFAGVIERGSTRLHNTDDGILSKAIELISREYADHLSVDEIAGRLNISRRTLEYRFRHKLGRSIHGEIMRQRLEKAQSLLLQSKLSLAQVAELCGFCNAGHLSNAFSARNGLTITQYRKNHGMTNPSSEGQSGT